MNNNSNNNESLDQEVTNDLNTSQEEVNEATTANNSADINAETTEEAPVVDELTQLKQKVNELNDKHLRLYAEYDNYKRRSAKERQDYMATAGKELFLVMAGILDDFDRALKAVNTATDVQAVKEGVELIHNKIKTNLISKGLEAVESIGQEFNSDVHEAITSIPAPTEEQKNKVIDEIEKGYNLNGKPLRVAKVVVGA